MKVAIIGAGINGLYLAWKLSENGNDVTVFEKKEKIGKKACSGLFSERILEFIPQSRKLIENEINFVLIHFPKRTFEINFSRKFFVMSHFQLDNLVAELAEKSGAKIILNHNLTKQGLVKLGEERTDRIIGCDGWNSVVRQYLDFPEPNYRLAIQGFVTKEDYSNFVETWPVNPAPEQAPYNHRGSYTGQARYGAGNGFIWKIPRGKEIEYGILSNTTEVKTIFDKFLAENNIQLEKLESAIVPQGFLIPRHSSITLCGDAAGLTKPWSGGGVIWGLMAAEILLKNFPDFLKYQKAMKRFFLPKIIFSKIATKITYFFGYGIPWLLPKKVKIEGDFLI